MLSNMPSLDGAAILEALPEGAILIDQEARICFINAAAVSILGIEGDRPTGQSLADLPGGFGLDGTAEQTGYLDLPDRWTRYRMAPLAMGAEPDMWRGTLILLDDIGRDILAHRDSANFVSALIHELRAPLASISGYANILLLGVMNPLTDIQREAIGVIKVNAGRALEEISHLLTAYRIRSGQLHLERAALDIASVVQEVAQTCADSYARQELTLTIDCQAQEAIVEAHDGAVRDILSILLEHACHHSQPKSEVRVTIVEERDHGCVTIQDTDIGFTAERLLAHRHRYWHVPMIAAQGLVKLHGGRLWAESVQGQGCKVSFTLPHAAA
jgi:signal transduction histidine kinase